MVSNIKAFPFHISEHSTIPTFDPSLKTNCERDLSFLHTENDTSRSLREIDIYLSLLETTREKEIESDLSLISLSLSERATYLSWSEIQTFLSQK